MIQFSCKTFESLSKDELYSILALRIEVFVVEQDCPYQDLDYKDQDAHHLIATYENKIVAYTRLLPSGISYPEHCSIGRVICAQRSRGKGIGRELMKESVRLCKTIFPNSPIKISAQTYLLDFYTNLGFQVVGPEYLEDNIPHVAMTLD